MFRATPEDRRPEEGRWSAMRVVDESARLAGLWRVSVGLQDGAQAERAILMFGTRGTNCGKLAVLHIHFGVSGQMWNTIDELPKNQMLENAHQYNVLYDYEL